MQAILQQFALSGAPLCCERYGSGHINETYLVETDAPHAYILQKINHTIFKNVDALMGNIIAVTEFLRRQGADARHVLTLVPTKTGEMYLHTDGGYYRVYEFITDSLCLDRAETANDFYQSAVAFGQFQNQLAGFPASSLYEIIPHFHDTPARYGHLRAAIKEDRAGRAHTVAREIDFYLQREKDADELMALYREGAMPLRVTHNDTKLNNVMLDARTRTPLCVIDLDTVMPGLAPNDFGDSIRFGASTAAEDEKDLDKVEMSLTLFEAYAKGFLSACGQRLNRAEIDALPIGAKLMTLECGTRFLADYLNGDIYFHVARPEHNLDRARTQMKLVSDMEKKMDEMRRIVLAQ